MTKTLVTGGDGLLSASTSSRELARRGERSEAAGPPRQQTRSPSRASSSSPRWATVTDRKAVRKAMKGVERVFHVAGTTSMQSRARDRVFEVNVEGTRNVMGEALRAGVGQGGAQPPAPAPWGRRRRAKTIDEDQPFTVGRLGHRLHQLQARGRACRDARWSQGTAGDDRQPVIRARARRPEPERHLQCARPPAPAAPHSRLSRRRHQHRRRPRCRQGSPPG